MPSTIEENAKQGDGSQQAPADKTAKQWMGAVQERLRAFEDWYKQAREAVEIYETKEEGTTPFNILFSNTETLLPALYNSTPRPDVARRFGMDAGTPAAAANHAAAEISNRFLEYCSDTNSAEYADFSAVTTNVTFSALLAGFGTARVHVTEQEVCFEEVGFDRFVWGFARTWKQVPWVAYGHDMSKMEFERQFPDAVAMLWYKSFTWPESVGAGQDTTPGAKAENADKKAKTLLVWEVWDWENKQISFVCSQSPEFLAQDPYPFDLTSRFPSPEPVRLIKRLLNLTPLTPYSTYKKEAEMLQKVTRRLNLVLSAIKVRGVYNGSLGELSNLLNDDTDNKLVPAENASAFIEGKGLEAQIWFLPIEMLVTVAQQMVAAQQEIKNTIYEIIGVADVMRGASQASETLGAQQIKNQWGTLRMKRAQKDIQVFCRDFFRIALEFGVQTLSPQQLKQITQVQYPLQVEQQQALQGKQAYEQAVAQAKQQGGQPPPEPTTAQLAATTLPTMEAACEILRDNFQRQYRIDIETNSTIDLEATEDQKQVGDFMNAFGQMMAGLTPLVEAGTMTFDVAKVIMIEVCRRFKFGRTVEDALETMVAPEGGGAGKQAEAMKQAQALADQQHQIELQTVKADAASKISKMEEQLVLKVGELEVCKVQLAEASLATATSEIHAAQSGFQKQVAMQGKVDSAQAAEHLGKVKAVVDKGVAKSREHMLTVKSLQKPEPAGKMP